jgi:uncharacterized alkaline shock family protein YloU
MTAFGEGGTNAQGGGAPRDRGRTTVADGVVGKIAFLTAQDVGGVHALGGTLSRSVGSLRKRVPGGGTSTHGVKVEVGEKQAALDLDIVVDYGEAVHEVASDVRQAVISAVERMTGYEVVEVNIAVSDVKLPDEEDEGEDEDQGSTRRVQ